MCGRGRGLWLTALSPLPAAGGLGRGAPAEAGGGDPPGEEGLQHQHVSGGERDAPPAAPGPYGARCHLVQEVQTRTGAVTRIHGKLLLRIPEAPKLVKNAGSTPVAGVGAVEHTVQRETSLLRTLESTTAQM